MGLKLFKRRARKESSAENKIEKAPERHSSQHSATNDESTASLRSIRSSALDTAAREGKWEQFVKIARDSNADDWAATTVDEQHHCLHGCTTPLHVALAYRAPLKTVEALIDLLATQFKVPVPEEAVDEQGRTPLHIAAAACCDEQVALRLLSGSTICMPAVTACADGQTPLHAAACHPIPVIKKKNLLGANPVQMMKWNKRRVMMVLMEQYPEAAAICDHAGKTPLDYVKEAGMKDSIVPLMQRVYDDHVFQKREEVCVQHMSEDLQHADVPFVVPSLTGSCRDFASLASLQLADVLDRSQDAPQEQHADDVSTIGDSEAEMNFLIDDGEGLE